MKKKKRILILEDEAALLYALQSRLSLEGHEILTTSRGEDAIQELKKSRPDLIVLDVILPTISGEDVFEHVQLQDSLKGVSVVVMSNLSLAEVRKRGLPVRTEDFLSKKDLSLDELVENISKRISGQS